VGIPWLSILAFLRLTTNPRVFERPLALDAACELVRGWLARPQVWIPVPTDRHADILESILPDVPGGANLLPDAHLAALALEYGLALCSKDGEFARFRRLRWENPLR